MKLFGRSKGLVALIGFLILISVPTLAVPPRAHHIYISGTTAGPNPTYAGSAAMKRNSTLKVWYTYADNDGNPEAGTTFQWYRYPNNFNAVGDFTGRVLIAGATLSTYTLAAADEGQHISVEVRPRNAIDGFGTTVEFRPWNAANPNPVYTFNANCLTPSGVGNPTPGNLVIPVSPGVCSPRTIQWQVEYTGINYRVGLDPKIIILWGDVVAPEVITPSLVNPLTTQLDTFSIVNMSRQKWRVVPTHIFDYAGGSTPSATVNERCTYTMQATWGFGATSCQLSGVQTQKLSVWDNESNTNLGQVDMSWDATSATGVEAGEVTNVCQGDGRKVVLADRSDFNCTPGGAAIETILPNDQARWVQFVYGTASTVTAPGGVGGSIIINNVSYSSAQLPIYGPVTYLPASVTTPSALSQSIQMPDVTGVAGQTFTITMRTWNTCAPFDINVLDLNGLNPPQGAPFNVFDIYSPLGTAPAPLGGPPFFANSTPATRTYQIAIITKPTPPVANNKDFCPATVLNPPSVACGAITAANQALSFELTAASVAGSSAINWYFGNPTSGGVLVTNNYGANCRFFQPGSLSGAGAQGAMRAAMFAGTSGVYSMWATYSIANGCVSDPVEVKLTVRPTLAKPAAPVGSASVCNGTSSAYTLVAPPSRTIPINTITNPAPVVYQTEYNWSASGAGVSFSPNPDNAGNNTVSFAVAPEPSPSTTRNIGAALQYQTVVTSGSKCPTSAPNNNLTVTIFGISNGGTITGSPTICDGSSTGNMTLSGHRGAVLQWERDFNGLGFVPIVGTTGLTVFSEIPPNGPGTYKYRVSVQNASGGPCAVVTTIPANQNTVTVNPVPPQPTITPSGATTFCFGGSVTLSSSNVTATTYQWYKDGLPVGGATSQTYLINTVGQSGSYTVQTFGIAPSSCPSPVSNPVPVTVNPLPTASNPAGGGSVCSGTPAPDIVWTLTGTPPFNFTITRSVEGPLPVVGHMGLTYTIVAPLPPASQNYQLTALTDANGCAAVSMGGSVTVNVIATPPPSVQSFVATAAVCDVGAGTNPPDAVLDLLPDLVQTYDVSYTINGTPFTLNGVATNASGQLTISPPYTAWGSTPGSYVITVTQLVNTVTLCAGVVPFNSTPLIVNATPVVNAGQVKTICSGSPVNLEVLMTPVNSPAGTTLSWPDPDGAGPATAKSIAADPAGTLHITDVLTNFTGANTTVTYVVTPTSAAGCAGTPRNVVITVNPAPVITPGQTKTICSGAAVNHTITLTPAGLPAGTLFSWPDPDGAGPATARAFPGTTAQIGDVLTNTTGADIVVTYAVTPRGPGGALGTCSGAVENVVITVRPAPVIVAGQTKTICSGQPVNLEILLSPLNLPAGTVFNWPIPTVSGGPAQGTAGVNVPMGVAGTNHITEVLTNTTGAPITVTYNVTPTAPVGVCSGTMRPIVITVNPEPVIPAGQAKAICSGQNTSLEILLSPANAPAGTVFNWGMPTMSAGAPQGSPGVNVPMGVAGTKHINDVLVNGTGAPITATYTVTPTSGAGCVGTARTVVVTINPLPVANPIGGPGTVCVDPTNIILYQVTPNAGSTFTWTIPPQFTVFGGGGTNSPNFFVLLSFPTVGGPFPISVIETNAFGCVGSSNSLPITVAPAPGALSINGPTVVCKNQTGVNFSVPAGIFNPTSTYNWSASGATIVSASSGVGLQTITVDFGLLASADITLNEVSSSGCSGTPVTVNVAAADRPVMTSGNTNTICSGNTPSLVFTTNALVPSTFNWQVITITGGVTGTTVGNTGTGNINEVLSNVSGFSGSVTYRVTPVAIAAPNCTGNSQDVVVTVNPEPVLVTPQQKTICSGASTSYEILLSPLTFPAGTSFTWPAPVMSAGAPQGTASPGSVAGGPAGTIHINDVLTNTTNAPITATYTITPTSGAGCLGTPRTVVITVNPQPVISNALDATHCSDDATGLTLAVSGTSVAAATYNVTARTIAVGLTAAGSNAFVPANGVAANYLANDEFINATNGALTVTYTVVGISASGCVGAPQVITQTINPEPVVSNTLDATKCSDVAIALTLATNGTSVAAANYNVTTRTIAPGLTANAGNAVVPANGVATNYLANDIFVNSGAAPLTVVYTVVPVSAIGCLGDPKSITITINPEPVVSTTLNAAICSDAATGLTLATNGASVAAAVYNVTARSISAGLTAAVTNVAVPANGVAAGYLAGDKFTNTGALPLTVTYTVEGVSISGCVSDPQVITMTINPEPVVSTLLNVTVCSDLATGLILNTNGTSVAAATYNITARTIQAGLTPGGSNALVTATGVAANYLANDQFSNTSAAPLTVTYTVVPVSASGCQGDPQVITITINPEPVVATTLDGTVCSDAVIGLTLNTNGSSVAAANYNVTARSIAAGLVAGGANVPVPASGVVAGYLANDVYTNTGAVPLTVTYTVAGVSAGACVGDSRVITMIINPEPVVSATLNTTVCSDLATGLVLNTNGTSVAAFNYNIVSRTIAGGLVANGSNAVVPASGVAANYLASDKFTNTTASPLTVNYTVEALSAAGCLGNQQVITVTINPEPVVSNTLDLTQCSNVAIGLVLGTNGTSEPAINYNILSQSIAAGLVAAGGNVAVPAAGVAANYLSNHTFANSTSLSLTVQYVVVPVSAAGCLGDAKTITVTIDAGPIVANNLNATVCSDDLIGLTLATDAASAPAANYNITARTVAGGLVAGGANAVVPFNGAPAAYLANDTYTNTGALPLTVTYTVVGVGVSGCVGNPRVITMTINPEPVVSATLNATVCSDAVIGLNLATNGTSVAALDYEIVSRTIDAGLVAAGGNVAVPANGVGSNYLASDKFTNKGANPLTVSYSVRARSAAGCKGDIQVITITINPEPVLSTTLNGTVCSDIPTGLVLNTNGTSVAAANYNITGVTVAAGLSAAGGNAVIPAAGVGVNYLSGDIFTNTGALPLTVVYTIVPVSAAGCLGDPATVTITINPEPVVSGSLDATLCSDIVAALILNTNGSSVAAASYNITASTVAGALVAGAGNAVVPAFGVAANYLGADVFTNTTNGSLQVTYTVVPVSAAGCVGNARVITLTINPEPVISPLLNATVCSDIATGLTLNTNGTSVIAASYNVTARTIDAGLTAAGTNAAVPSNNVAANFLASDKFVNNGAVPLTVTYTVVGVSAAGCVGNPQVITITINPEPVVSSALDLTQCSDVAIGLMLTTEGTSVAAANYNITARTVAAGLTVGASNAPITANGVAANYLAADVYTNNGTTPLNVTYTVVPVSAAGCPGDPKVITVTINPEPVVLSTLDATVCSDAVVGLTLNTTGTSAPAANYNITARSIAAGLVPAGTNAAVPAVAVANSYLAADAFTNPTNGSLTVTYTVVPVTAAGCLGDPKVITMTINPEPVVSPSLDATKCSDASISLTLATNGTSVAAANYIITARTVSAGLVPAGTNAVVPAIGVAPTYLLNDKYTNSGPLPLTVTYTVVPVSAAGCVGDAVVVTMTIDPEPVVANGLDATVCSDLALGLTLNTNGTSVAAGTYNITSRTIAAGLLAGGTNAIVPAAGVADNYLAADFFTNVTAASLTVTYTVVPVSAAGCLGDAKIITMTIQPEPVVASGLDAARCSDVATGLTLATTGTSAAAANYNITSITIAPGLIAAGANAVVPAVGVAPIYMAADVFTNPTLVPLTVQYTVVPVSATGCLGDSKIITITIGAEPVGANDVKTICSDAAVTYNLQTNVNTLGNGFSSNFTWIAAPNANVTGESTVAQAGPIITDVLNNVTNADQVVVYTVTPTGTNGCAGNPFTVSVTVQPEPVGANEAVSINSDIILNYNLQNNVNTIGNNLPANFSWVASINSNVGGESTTPQAGAVITDILNNVTNANQTVTYTVIPTGTNGCVGNPFIITVTVLPEPVGFNDLVTVNSDVALSYSLQNNVNSGGNAVPATFVWQAADNPLVTGESLAGQPTGTLTDVLHNVTGVDQVVVYTVIPTGTNGVLGDPFTITVTVRSEPVGANDAVTVCSDIAANYDLQNNLNTLGNGQTATFGWFATANPNVTGESTTLQSGAFIIDLLNNVTNADEVITYTVTPTGTNGAVGDPFQIAITVRPEPVVANTLNETKCSGEVYGKLLATNGISIAAASYNVTVVSKDAGITGGRPLGLIGGGGSADNVIQGDSYVNTTATPQKVVYSVVPVGTNGCLGDAKLVEFTINPEPVLLNPGFPAVCSSNTSVSNIVNVVLGTNGTSASASSYQLMQIQYSNGGPFGVALPAGFTAAGGNALVGATGSIDLVKNDRYTNTSMVQVTVRYTIQGTSSSGCKSANLDYDVVINPEPTLDPLLNPTPVCSGVISSVTLGVAAGSVAATTYNINSILFPGLTAGGSNTGIGNGKPANAIFNDVYVNTTSGVLTAIYKISPVTAAGCMGPEGTVTLTINPSPDLANNLNKIACTDAVSGILFTTTAASTPATAYNLISVTPAPGLVPNGANVIPANGVASNYVGNDRFSNPTNSPLTVIYRVEPVSAAACKGPQEDITLTVEPTIIAAPISLKPNVCSGSGNGTDLTDIELISPTNPTAGVITFNYTAVSSVGTQITGFVPALSGLAENYKITDNLVNTSNSPATVTYTITPVAAGASSGTGCSGTPAVVVVTVEPKPKLVAATLKTLCEGVATNISLTSPTTPSAGTIEFLLVTAVPTGGVTGMSANGTVFANGSTLNDVLSNPLTTAQTVTYTMRPRINGGAGCIGDDVFITVTVNPRPTVTPSPQPQICSGDVIDITLTTDVAATVSTWTVTANPTITGASAGAGDRIFQILFNSGNIVETVTYNVTPQAAGCAGTTVPVAVQVNPKAKVLGVPSTVTVCHGASLNVPLTSNVAAATFAWTVDDPSGLGVPATGSGNVINQPMTNTLGFQATLTYTITPTGPGPGTGCVGESKIIIVTVSPQITASWLNTPSPDFICKGSKEFLVLNIGGRAPFNFTYNDGGAPINKTNQPPVAVLQHTPLVTTTYTLTSVTDGLGCTTPFNVPFVVNVGDTDPNFTITSPVSTCSPNVATFQYNQVTGTIYTWRFGDAPDSVYTATTTVANMVVKHTYVNLSPSTTLNYPVTLQTELPAPYPGCFKSTTKQVTIFPNPILNVVPNRTDICSGESITFTNSSVGTQASTIQWSYRVQGQVPETVMGTTFNMTYTFNNTTTANPIIYEVIFRASNSSGCVVPAVIMPINVYRYSVASFTEGVVPPFINGESIVPFTNNSSIIDAAAFDYDWVFGPDSDPPNFAGTTPAPIRYVSPGPKDITLTVTNKQRAECKTTFTKSISIVLPPLIAKFDADPKKDCFPAKISVSQDPLLTEITGDIIEWSVVDDATNRVVATSSGVFPVFEIPVAGDYRISVVTKSSMTGQQAQFEHPQLFHVFGKPFASFDARPDVVFVPDTQLDIFNFSTSPQDLQFTWDFGDGDVLTAPPAPSNAIAVPDGTHNGRTKGTYEEPSHFYKVEGIYELTLYANYDHGDGVVCSDTLKHTVQARQGGITKVPNAFTPSTSGPSGGQSGNGSFNDVFLPIVKGADEFNLQIYDRWGNLIFESNSNQIGWDGYSVDGKLMPAGVYVYKLTVRLSDGQRSTQIGDVTMIR